jgi:hypothetical protein
MPVLFWQCPLLNLSIVRCSADGPLCAVSERMMRAVRCVNQPRSQLTTNRLRYQIARVAVTSRMHHTVCI